MICTQVLPPRLNSLPPEESENLREVFFDLQKFAEGGDKTEEPTDKKRRDARNKGQVARSQELNAAFVLLAGFFAIRLLWEDIYTSIADYSAYIFANLATTTVSAESAMVIFLGIVEILVKIAEALETTTDYLLNGEKFEPEAAPKNTGINLPININNSVGENKVSNDDLDLEFLGGVVERAERAARSNDSRMKFYRRSGKS